MLKSTFMNGGFVLHKIELQGSACRFSAWYDKNGNLLADERVTSRNFSYSATERQKAELDQLGKIWKTDEGLRQ